MTIDDPCPPAPRRAAPEPPVDPLPADLLAVTTWLRSQGLPPVALSAHRHHGQMPPEVAYVVAGHPDAATRRTARMLATRALAALGHRLAPQPGADVWHLRPLPASDLSSHERLELVARVRAAIEADQPGDGDAGRTGTDPG